MADDEFRRFFMLFTDASIIALGAVLYSVSLSLSGKTKCSFIMAKSRLLTVLETDKRKKAAETGIPYNKGKHPLAVNRAELLATVLGARMFDMLRPELPEGVEVHAWTDSINVARWLHRGPVTGSVNLDNKIQEVYTLLPGVKWRHVPGLENPADLCTRPQTGEQLLASSLWAQGPSWMADESQWPQQSEEIESHPDYAQFLKEKDDQEKDYTKMITSSETDDADSSSQIIGAVRARPPVKRRKYSEPLTDILFRDNTSWSRVVVTYALILRVRDKILDIRAKKAKRTKIQTRSSARQQRLEKVAQLEEFKSSEHKYEKIGIDAIEYHTAELALLRLMQKQYDGARYDMLRKNPELIIDGLAWSSRYDLVVSRSRHCRTEKERSCGFGKDLIHIPLSYTYASQKYLNRVAEMMIQAHEETHGAARSTLTTFRVRFWISRGTAMAKWAKRQCPYCIRMDARVVTAPPAPLPEYRSSFRRPFEAVGMDFLGPLQKLHDTKQNTYILIFTCSYTRATILRPLLSESAEAFVSAFNTIRHEFAIDPIDITSDQGSGLTSSYDKTIKDAVELLGQKFPRIRWRFNASRAPWWGGFFERLNYIIKDRLARCFMSYDALFTNYATFTEAVAYVMSVLNSRPLTWISDDPDENRHPICPQIFLNFYSKYNFLEENPWHYGPHRVDYTAAKNEDMKKMYRAKARAYNNLFDVFREYYISELRSFQNQKKKPSDHKLKVGMMVLFRAKGLFKKDGAGSRRKWKLARILKLHRSPMDARVRSVDLAVYDHKRNCTKILPSQSIANIAILETDHDEDPAWLTQARRTYLAQRDR